MKADLVLLEARAGARGKKVSLCDIDKGFFLVPDLQTRQTDQLDCGLKTGKQTHRLKLQNILC
jgi:hypothetical protein